MALELDWLSGNLTECLDAADRVRGTYGFGITAVGEPFWDPGSVIVPPEEAAHLQLDRMTGALLLMGQAS